MEVDKPTLPSGADEQQEFKQVIPGATEVMQRGFLWLPCMDFLLFSNLAELKLQHFPLGKVLILACFLHLSDSFLKTQEFSVMELSQDLGV